MTPFVCSIQPTVYKSILQQFPVYTAARESFDEAVYKLSNFAELSPSDVSYHKAEIQSLISFIERSLDSTDIGFMFSWYNEKHSLISKYFNDMFRRKQGNHPNYKLAQDYIRKTLCSYHAPCCWRKYPPLLPVSN